MKKLIAFLDDHITMVVAAIVIIVAFALHGCNGCKRPVEPVQNVVDVIEQTHNPKIDSLQAITIVLLDSVAKLNGRLKQQTVETTIAERKARAASDRLQQAINNQDTAKIIVYADDIIEEYDAYIQNTNKQDSIQEAIIEKQAAVIINDRAEIDLHESKYNQLKVAYNIQEVHLSDAARANEKLQKKLKRSKFFNKVLGITTAAGAVLAGIVFL